MLRLAANATTAPRHQLQPPLADILIALFAEPKVFRLALHPVQGIPNLGESAGPLGVALRRDDLVHLVERLRILVRLGLALFVPVRVDANVPLADQCLQLGRQPGLESNEAGRVHAVMMPALRPVDTGGRRRRVAFAILIAMEAFVRAGTAQDTMAFLDRWRPGLRDEVLAHVPPESLARIRESGRTGWVEIEHDVTFVDAIVETMGHADAVAVIRASVQSHFSGALLATLVRGAQRIFGMTPTGLMKMVPRAWPMVYKNFGQVTFSTRTPNHGVLTVHDAHPLAYTADGYLASWEGIFAGIVDVGTRQQAEAVRVHIEIDQDEPRFSIHTQWSQPGQSE